MKKVLSFVLVLSLVLSSFSMAFAGEAQSATLSDVAGVANEEAINVVNDLGIVTGYTDGTFKAEKAVNRAEFAVMLTKALAIPESALAAYTATNFTDVAGYDWAVPYLAFCESKGIMSGYGNGLVKPGNTITVNEAMTMALRAIGYTPNSARLQGAWPSNYVTLAQDLGIYTDVAAVATVDRGSAAQIVYNVLTEPKVTVNADGDTAEMWNDANKNGVYDLGETYVTLLTAGLECTEDPADIVDLADVDNSLINMAKNLGKYGNLYKNEDGEIVAFIADCEQLTGSFWTDGSDVIFKTADAKEYTVEATTVAALDVAATDTASVVAIPADNGVTYTLSADISGNKIKAAYSAVAYTVEAADYVEKADLEELAEDQELFGYSFILDDNDEIDYTQFVLVGVASLDKIAVDDVVYVAVDKDDEVRMVAVSNKTVTGVVKNYKPADAGEFLPPQFSIGTDVYKNAAEILNVADASMFASVGAADVAEEVTLYLDAYGMVFDFESTATIDDYAVVLKVDAGITDQAKLIFADGSEKVVELDLDADDLAGVVQDALIGYDLDKDGVLAEVDTTSAVDVGYATLESINVINTQNNGKLDISEDTVVFTYDLGDDEYAVTTMNKVDVDETLGANVMAFIDDGEVLAMVIDAAAAESGDSVYAVANDYIKTANDDGDAVYQVVGYKDGEKLDALTDDETGVFDVAIAAPAYTTDNLTVQLYDITINADGVIIEGELVVHDGTEVVVVEDVKVTDANGRNSITDASTKYALDEAVVVYEVNSDMDYKVYNGSLRADDVAVLYNLDAEDDSDYDVVFFYRQ